MSDYTLQKTGADIDTILSNADADHAALGQPSGIATLSANGTLKEAQLPPSAINAVDFNLELDNSQGKYTVGETEITSKYDVVWLRSADGTGRFAAIPNPSIVGQALHARWPGWEKICTSAGLPLPEKLYRRKSDNALLARDAYKFAALTPVGMNDVLLKTAQSLTTEEQVQVKKNLDISKKDLFIDMWNQACGSYGKYNPDTGYFELNGLTDITYDQALAIYRFGDYNSMKCLDNAPSYLIGREYPLINIRTTLPSCTVNDMPYISLGWSPYYMETIRFSITSPNSPARVVFTQNNNMPLFNNHILAIYDYIRPTKAVIIGRKEPTFNQVLETIYIYKLAYNITINSPVISYESIRFMVDNAINTSPITITVHPDIYAKLTGGIIEIVPLGAPDITSGSVPDPTNPPLSGEDLQAWQQLVTDAAAKNITFVTV